MQDNIYELAQLMDYLQKNQMMRAWVYFGTQPVPLNSLDPMSLAALAGANRNGQMGGAAQSMGLGQGGTPQGFMWQTPETAPCPCPVQQESFFAQPAAPWPQNMAQSQTPSQVETPGLSVRAPHISGKEEIRVQAPPCEQCEMAQEDEAAPLPYPAAQSDQTEQVNPMGYFNHQFPEDQDFGDVL